MVAHPTRFLSTALRSAFLTGAFGCLLVASRAATPSGTRVHNQARVEVALGKVVAEIPSNTDVFEVAEAPKPPETPSIGTFAVSRSGTAEVQTFPATYVDASGCEQAARPVLVDGGLANPDGSTAVRIEETAEIVGGKAALVRVTEPALNTNPSMIDTAEVVITAMGGAQTPSRGLAMHAAGAGDDAETLWLRETAPNSGVFAAVVVVEPTAQQAKDGRISMAESGRLEIRVAATGRQQTIPVKVPEFGTVFDATTGEPIDGVTVTLLDARTGLAAEVFGSDGAAKCSATVTSGAAVRDSAGAEYPAHTGQFVFPRVRAGSYRLRVTLPERSGYAFPSAAVVTGSSFSVGVGSRGEPFTTEGGPVESNLPLDPDANTLALNLTVNPDLAGVGEFVEVRAEVLNNRFVGIANVGVKIDFPQGLAMDFGSVRVGGVPAHGGANVHLGRMEPGRVEVRWLARVLSTSSRRIRVSAQATSPSLASTPSSATLSIRDDFGASRANVVGRVRDHAGRGVPGVTLYLETGAMVTTDRRGRFHFPDLATGTHVVQIDVATLPASVKIAPALSQVVDLAGGTLWRTDFTVTGSHQPVIAPEESASAPNQESFGPAWFNAQPKMQDWAFPSDGMSFEVPSTRIVVKHHVGHKLTVRVNGAEVPAVNYDGRMLNKDRSLACSVWSGVNLREGANEIEVLRIDSFGITRKQEKRVVHFAGPPTRAEFVAAQSVLRADGKVAPLFAVRFTDKDGKPARQGVTGNFSVLPPHSAYRTETMSALAPGGPGENPKYVVGIDGVALLKLEPTTDTGEVRVVIPLVSGSAQLAARLGDERKDWIVVGVAEAGSGTDPRASADGRIAFFAKGQVKGGWTVTAALDSERDASEVGLRVAGVQPSTTRDPLAGPTTWGDSTKSLTAAPSSGKGYFKAENGATSVMYGDYALNWSAGTLVGYNRALHGVKVETARGRWQGRAFTSDAGLRFRMIEIPADGTSGPFALPRDLVSMSDRVVVQERDLLHSETVLGEVALSRNFDYTIDYAKGSLQLSRPLAAVSAKFNPLVIVVRCETMSATSGMVSGARLQYGLREESSVGLSTVSETQDGRSTVMTGIDARLALSKTVVLRAELAQSESAGQLSYAMKADMVRRGAHGDSSLFYRRTDDGFGLGQLFNEQLGNEQYGVETRQQLSVRTSVQGKAYREVVLTTGEHRDAASAKIEHVRGGTAVRIGIEAVHDERTTGATEALLGVVGVSQSVGGGRVVLHADRSQNLLGGANNPDFPNRTNLGATFKTGSRTEAFIEHQLDDAVDRKAQQTLLGMRSTPWSGAMLTSGVSQTYGTAGTTLFNGLDQKWDLSTSLRVEFGAEHAGVVSGEASPARSESPFHPVTVRLPDVSEHSAMHLGAQWKPADTTYRGRIEMARTRGRSRAGLVGSAQTDPNQDLSLLGSVMASDSGNTRNASVRLGAAWRPDHGGLTVLQRLDLLHETESDRVVENLMLNQKLGTRGQMSLHIGAKWVKSSFGEESVSAWSAIALAELRWNLTRKWDIGAQIGGLTMLGRAGGSQMSYGLSLGRTLTTDLWVGCGYNQCGFADRDFVGARFAREGAYLKIRVKFDQQSIGMLLRLIAAE